MTTDIKPVIVSPSLKNFFLCAKGHEVGVNQGEFVTFCKYKDPKTKRACKAGIVKISRTEYYCALPGCRKSTTNSAPSWCRVSIGFARDDGSGGALQNRHVENVRFCCDEHASEYLQIVSNEVFQW